jgi:glyoxylase-like metal-dependent hydrolase (beta-lactamase superfamily II)
MSRLHLIDLDQELAGQRRFISCWARLGGDLNYIVDPGPPATGARLMAELENLGLERLDFILLTHIHLDHGGATSAIVRRWPEAHVICHKSGRAHLADPERLWQGSRQVLGRAAEVYGEPEPVPERALVGFATAVDRGIEVVHTPGHAPHHISFLHEGNLFLGEAAGTYSSLGKGPENKDYYLRPATPPRYFPAVAADSIDRLLDLDPFPRRLCFAHHGQHMGDGRALLTKAKRQLHVWLETVREVADGGALPAEEDAAGMEEFMATVQDRLLAIDSRYARMNELPDDIRIREDQFTRQTLRGMIGHLRSID